MDLAEISVRENRAYLPRNLTFWSALMNDPHQTKCSGQCCLHLGPPNPWGVTAGSAWILSGLQESHSS